MVEIIQPNFEFEDERGKLVQLVREGFSQFNIVFSKAGSSRGSHYHKENREAFYVIVGEFDVIVEKENKCETLSFFSGDMFLIPPLVCHSFFYHTDTLLVAMYDIGIESIGGEKDIFKLGK